MNEILHIIHTDDYAGGEIMAAPSYMFGYIELDHLEEDRLETIRLENGQGRIHFYFNASFTSVKKAEVKVLEKGNIYPWFA